MSFIVDHPRISLSLAVPAVCIGLLTFAWRPAPETDVKIRGLVHLYNALKSKPTAAESKVIKDELSVLFEQVVVA